MDYLSTFFEIDRALKLESISLRFSQLIDNHDLLVIISSYLTIQQLIAFISVNRKALKLSQIPVLQVRLLKAQLSKVKIGHIQPNLDLRIDNRNMNIPFSSNHNAPKIKKCPQVKELLLKQKELLEKKQKSKYIMDYLKDESTQIPQFLIPNKKQIDEMKFQKLQRITFKNLKSKITKQVIQQVTLIQLQQPTLKQTFSSIHTSILSALDQYYESKEQQKIKKEILSHHVFKPPSPSVLKTAVTKIENLVDMIKFSFS